MLLEFVKFRFGLLSFIIFPQTHSRCTRLIIIGVKTIENPSSGRPKGGRGRVIELAG